MFVFKIGGVDMVPYISENGIKWTREDIDGPNAGRTMSGTMIRDRVATKIRLDVSCRPLANSELETVLTAISPEYVSVQYYDPMAMGVVTKRMYSNNVPATITTVFDDDTVRFADISFPLIEV